MKRYIAYARSPNTNELYKQSDNLIDIARLCLEYPLISEIWDDRAVGAISGSGALTKQGDQWHPRSQIMQSGLVYLDMDTDLLKRFKRALYKAKREVQILQEGQQPCNC